MPTTDRVVHARMAGCAVQLMEQATALDLIGRAAARERGRPLAVASANLDHLHHFGRRGASRGSAMVDTDALEWLTLLDGAPLVLRAHILTRRAWPRLPGSELLGPILVRACNAGASVGFVGGTDRTLSLVQAKLRQQLPKLRVAGSWSPTRAQVTDPASSVDLASTVRSASVDVLVVSLGKPRQEVWIQRHAAQTGAAVLLAFGAATDFLAGTARRAPSWTGPAGLEWAYRLGREPRRMWRRYLLQGPRSAVQLLDAQVLAREDVST